MEMEAVVTCVFLGVYRRKLDIHNYYSASSLFNFRNKPANPIVIQEVSTLDQGCVAVHQVEIGFKHADLLHTLKQNPR